VGHRQNAERRIGAVVGGLAQPVANLRRQRVGWRDRRTVDGVVEIVESEVGVVDRLQVAALLPCGVVGDGPTVGKAADDLVVAGVGPLGEVGA